jgi:rSAM/selenodomain-associated transferase 1
MARAPSSPGKTRLEPHLSAARLHTLRRALILDTLAVVHAIPGFDVFLFVTPDECVEEIAALGPVSIACEPQGEGDLGQRMRSAFEHLLETRGYAAAILVGTDSPLMTRDHLAAARETLAASGGVGLGPADDGGYFLIGADAVHDALFRGVTWGSHTVLADTLRIAAREGVETRLVGSAYDVDTIEDLRRVERDLVELPADVAPALRAWFSES